MRKFKIQFYQNLRRKTIYLLVKFKFGVTSKYFDLIGRQVNQLQ